MKKMNPFKGKESKKEEKAEGMHMLPGGKMMRGKKMYGCGGMVKKGKK